MSSEQSEPVAPPRPAATVLVVRRTGDRPSLLMGQRGANAAFMPSKYVFPGGALDEGDAGVPLISPLGSVCAARIAKSGDTDLPDALAVAAVRELWEETGLILGKRAVWPATVPQDWEGFAAEGYLPDAAALRFFFRAITPPGRSRRFDARFFLADAAALATDPDDFSRASDELSHLHWVALDEAAQLNLPFITEVVIAELSAYLEGLAPDAPLPTPASVPFFDNSGPVPTFRHVA
jgi:8-oxo-dGTP pyrophosphatase MutT (NUDIX family)